MTVLMQVANYLLWFASMMVMLTTAGAFYVWWTPLNEVRLIRQGNTAAAIALGGTMLGYATVVYSAMAHVGTTIPIVVGWAAVALAVQLLAFEVMTRFVLGPTWKEQIEDGCIAHGVALGTFSWAVGHISAGCLSP